MVRERMARLLKGIEREDGISQLFHEGDARIKA